MTMFLTSRVGPLLRQGARIGLAYRFMAGRGVYGINSFCDRNRIKDDLWNETIVHDCVSVGADWQDDADCLSANYHLPLSDDFQRCKA